MNNSSLDQWKTRCHSVLQRNQIVLGNGLRYTRPAPMIYEQQWLWDSCFHAIVWRWLDATCAWQELRCATAKQLQTGADAGMIPHMNYWDGRGTALWNTAERSVITQPPLIAIAAWLTHQKNPNLAALAQLYPQLEAYHNWFSHRRELDNDDMVWLIHPWETGQDATPRWDAAMGFDAKQIGDNTANSGNPSIESDHLNTQTYYHNEYDNGLRQARIALVHTLIKHQCDAGALRQASSFCIAPLDFNAIRCADLEALGNIAQVIDLPAARYWRQKSADLQATLQQHLAKLSSDDLRHQPEVWVNLFCGAANQIQAMQMAQGIEHALATTPYPLSSVPLHHAAFAPARYWRGNVWLPLVWLIWAGLRRYGYDDLAKKLTERIADLIQHSGFREYFNPISGEGLGSEDHSWTTLILDMQLTGYA